MCQIGSKNVNWHTKIAQAFLQCFTKEEDGLFKHTAIVTGDEILSFKQVCQVKTVVNAMVTLITSEANMFYLKNHGHCVFFIRKALYWFVVWNMEWVLLLTCHEKLCRNLDKTKDAACFLHDNTCSHLVCQPVQMLQ